MQTVKMEEDIIFYGIAVLFSIAGFYFAVKAFLSFRNTPDDVLRAKIFLNKNFLRNNLILVFIAGALVCAHAVLEFMEYGFAAPYTDATRLLYSITLPMIAFLMSLLAYLWNKALYRKTEMFVKTK